LDEIVSGRPLILDDESTEARSGFYQERRAHAHEAVRAGSIRCAASSTIARVPVGVDSNRKAARSPYLRANRWRTAIIPYAPVPPPPSGRPGPLPSMSKPPASRGSAVTSPAMALSVLSKK